MKPVSPYERLKKRATQWAFTVVYAKRISVWVWKKPEGDLLLLRERVSAANALGYDVKLSVQDEGTTLAVHYVKRPDVCPWEFEP